MSMVDYLIIVLLMISTEIATAIARATAIALAIITIMLVVVTGSIGSRAGRCLGLEGFCGFWGDGLGSGHFVKENRLQTRSLKP